MNNATQKIEKYESLVRLVTEDGKLLTPFYFLDTAKKGRYYTKITKIVLDNLFATLAKIPEASISINLSMHDIERDEITSYIDNLLVQYENEAHRIIFELLESEDIKDFFMIKQFIKKVKTKGVKIAIDDFGTGYSNFERLLSYEPDILNRWKFDSQYREQSNQSTYRWDDDTFCQKTEPDHGGWVCEKWSDLRDRARYGNWLFTRALLRRPELF